MYTLRFPFSLPVDHEIAVTEHTIELDAFTLFLKKQGRFYVLIINGFPTEDAANCYIKNIWAGLMWLLLHRDLSPDAILKPQEVTYAEDPYKAAQNLTQGFGLNIDGPVDGLIDGSKPAVYPTDKVLRTITGGIPTVTQTSSADDVLNLLSEGVAFPGSSKVIEDAKLNVAFDLYGSYFTERSANARFLTLVMALEALAIGTKRTQLVLGLLEKWKVEAVELKNTLLPESEDAVSLEGVIQQLLFRKEDSIRRQIRELVSTTLRANGDVDATEVARNAVRIYDLRSSLVHDGKLEAKVLSKAISDVKDIVVRVLRAKFVQKAAINSKTNV